MKQMSKHTWGSSRLRAYLRFLGTGFIVNIKSVIEYRVNFLLQFFGMMLNNAAFAAFWAILIAKTGTVGGYDFYDIIFVWGFVSSAFGLAHIVLGNIRDLSRVIIEGGLDVYLLQPKDVWDKYTVVANHSVSLGRLCLRFYRPLAPARKQFRNLAALCAPYDTISSNLCSNILSSRKPLLFYGKFLIDIFSTK